jgi:UDP-N-acetylmuramoyl-L-alanyl-D-glutamate--2,6-diaminopimelate ligase
VTSTTRRIDEILAAAEPGRPKALGGLEARLATDGQLVMSAAAPGTLVQGVGHDSRVIGPGMLFVAVHGAHVDGHAFAAAAVARGAVALLVERELPGLDRPQVVVRSTQRALAAAAAWWFGDPSRELGVIGVTGTDGKTTTAYLALAGLEAAGLPAGMITTIAMEIGDHREPNQKHTTTPEAPQLQRALRAMVRAGDRAAVLETTSHGLALERVAEIGYDIAIFTNLTHEHLDLHGSFEAYRDAKRSLFARLAVGSRNPVKPSVDWPRAGIVNSDDPSAAVFEAATREAGARLLRYGAAADADVRLVETHEERQALVVRYVAASGAASLRLHLAGRFNAYNALAVVALGEALGLDAGAVRGGLESVAGVPGRMERVVAGQPFAVVVDFAHTPGALEAALGELGAAVRAEGGRVISVFGASGERDVAKRPLMGRVAGTLSDLVVVTEDDSRNEDPAAIYDAIAQGAEEAGRRRGVDLLVIPDRREAIAVAVSRAGPGDVVLLAGKGHETWNMGPHGAEPWDERGAALTALAALRYDEIA